jgi:2-methylcitrate dehydratase
LGGIEESTVIGSGLRTTAANATIVNSFLVRFLDYNDYGGGGHISDSIPGVLAVAEREKSNGRDFLASLVIPYELGERFAKAAAGYGPGPAEGEAGEFAVDIKAMPGFCEVGAGLIMPAALGRLMKLNEEQIANAIGICACHSITLKVLDSDREENSMSKNLRYGWSSYNAILSCMLAKEGFTGPIRVVEGQNGIEEVVLGTKLNLQELLDFSGWRILKIRNKAIPVCAIITGQALAAIDIVREHDLKPDDIVAVSIKTDQPLHHTTCLPKKYPRNAESADHSTYYIIAAAIKERKVDIETVEPDKFTDPVILDLIEKIALEVDPSLPMSGAVVTITTKDGRSFHKDIPNSFGNDPLTDAELEEKFRQMAIKYIPEKQIQKIFSTIWNLEDLNDMGKLMALLVFKAR